MSVNVLKLRLVAQRNKPSTSMQDLVDNAKSIHRNAQLTYELCPTPQSKDAVRASRVHLRQMQKAQEKLDAIVKRHVRSSDSFTVVFGREYTNDRTALNLILAELRRTGVPFIVNDESERFRRVTVNVFTYAKVRRGIPRVSTSGECVAQ